MRQPIDRGDIAIKPGVFVGDDFSPDIARLRGTRCTRCAETFFPPRGACPRCHTRATLVEVALGRTGKISSITMVARPPHHLAQPYWLAEIDLADGIRLLAQVDADHGKNIPVGTDVAMTTRPLLSLPNGQRLWGYVFAPVEPAKANA